MSDTLGFGYMIAEHGGGDFNEVGAHVERALSRYRTMMPVRVVKVYKQDGKTTATRGEVAGAGFIDAIPMVSQVDGMGQKMDHGTVYHIPYTRNYGGNGAVICDPVVGDIGWIQCADRDISAFKDQIKQGSTNPVLPGSRRRYDMSDTLYVGGVLNNAPAQYVTFQDAGITIHDVNNNQVVMNKSGITITDTNGNKVVLDSGGSITLTPSNNTVVINGDLHATGAVIAGYGGGGQVGLQTHVHTDPEGGNTGAPVAGT